MKTEKRIAFACFTGAALGAVLALQLHLFWWLGILVGGATGYVSYSFREIMEAAVTAWKTVPGTRFNIQALKAGLINAAKFVAVLACIICGAMSVLVLSIGGLMLLAGAPDTSPNWQAAPESEAMQTPHHFWVLPAAGILVLGIMLLVGILRSADRKGTCVGILGCIAATPLALPITLTVVFLSAVVPRGARLLVKLARQTFFLIHSELRLLCLTDALLGALVGYLCGNALMGGVVGAVLGWGNYRLVAIKWLKLAKA